MTAFGDQDWPRHLILANDFRQLFQHFTVNLILASAILFFVGGEIAIPSLHAQDEQLTAVGSRNAPSNLKRKIENPGKAEAVEKVVDHAETVRKQKAATVLMLVFAGLLALILLLFLLVLVLSRRTHRLLREPLPAASRVDELWFLRAKRNVTPPEEDKLADSTPDSPLP